MLLRRCKNREKNQNFQTIKRIFFVVKLHNVNSSVRLMGWLKWRFGRAAVGWCVIMDALFADVLTKEAGCPPGGLTFGNGGDGRIVVDGEVEEKPFLPQTENLPPQRNFSFRPKKSPFQALERNLPAAVAENMSWRKDLVLRVWIERLLVRSCSVDGSVRCVKK